MNLQKYRKIKDSVSHQIFETDLGKKNRAKNILLYAQKKKKKKKKKKEEKKILQSYTPCLDSQSVKTNSFAFCRCRKFIGCCTITAQQQDIQRT